MKRKLVLVKKLPVRPRPPQKLGGKPLCSRYQNGAAIVAKHPQAKLIVQWLREGVSAASIARYLSQHRLIEQAVATFTDYVLQFKLMHPELLKDNPTISLDDIISPNQPAVAIESELHRMFRLQKTRLAISTQEELTTGRLRRDGHKDLMVAHEYLETMAKVSGTQDPNSDEALQRKYQQYTPEVREKLISIKREEESFTRMRVLTEAFIKKYEPKDNKSPP